MKKNKMTYQIPSLKLAKSNFTLLCVDGSSATGTNTAQQYPYCIAGGNNTWGKYTDDYPSFIASAGDTVCTSGNSDGGIWSTMSTTLGECSTGSCFAIDSACCSGSGASS